MKRIHIAAALAAFTLAGSALAQSASAPAAAAAPAAPAAPAATAPAAAPAAGAESGKIAWYGRKFNGRKTACGERFNAGAMTMAHKSLACGTKVKVTNTKTKKSVVLRVNDHGPSTADRVGDVSAAAARKLRMGRAGVVEAQIEVIAAPAARAAKKARK